MSEKILKTIDCSTWNTLFTSGLQQESTAALENGKIILLPQLPFTLLAHENRFLSPDCANHKTKNISFSQKDNSLRGTRCIGNDYEELKIMLQRFMQSARNLIKNIFPTYAAALQLGRTSFRPVEISGRASSYRKDDTRLHVDAFPATPNQGRRILRVFSNINPHGQSRVWRTGEPFRQVAQRFSAKIAKALPGKAELLKMFWITKSYRTEYDHLMLQIHDRMKADLDYQNNVTQEEIHFLPGSSWIVQTDHVSHAAMAGQYVLEQTFYLPVHAMLNPALSPLRTLENLTGRQLVKAC